MKDNEFSFAPPIRCVLATDSRFGLPDFVNDQIWELSTSEMEPPSLMLHTTYGLRAYWMKIFPSFMLGDHTLTDPRLFDAKPIIDKQLPSYVSLKFSPFSTIDANMEVWVPTSQTITCRIQIKNTGSQIQNFKMIWNVLLNPISHGQRMNAQQFGLNTVLQGHTQNLSPVFYITGGPEPVQAPYPALAINMMMQPGLTRTITWAMASLRTVEESFNLARQITGRNWDAELLKMEMAENRQCFKTSCSEKKWDAVFSHSQTRVYQLFMGVTPRSPNRSILLSRNPDQGFSLRGDGSDYGPDWTGFTALNAWYSSKFLLPGNPEIMKEILQNFWDAQRVDGFIPNLVGSSGQQGSDLAAPILAECTWRLFEVEQDKEWLKPIYSNLIRFLQFWLKNDPSKTNIYIPTWQNPAQAALETNWHFDPANPLTKGINIARMVSPGLLSMLFRECQNLIRMADLLQMDELGWLQNQSQMLLENLEKCWNEKKASYCWMDGFEDGMSKTRVICKHKRNGDFPIKKDMLSPGHIAICIQRGGATLFNLQITLQGQTKDGAASESFSNRQIDWRMQFGRALSEHKFTSLDSIKIAGLHPGDEITCYIPGTDFEEISLLLPLWAGVPTPKRAQQIIEKTISTRYITPFGLASIPTTRPQGNFSEENEISIFWNSLVLEGLQLYGFKELAARLFESILAQEVKFLQNKQGLYPCMQVQTGKESGDRDTLEALIPVTDLVHLLGARIWTDHEMIIDNLNTFLPPITVKYYGTKVEFLVQETKIQSLFGENYSITAELPQRILFPG